MLAWVIVGMAVLLTTLPVMASGAIRAARTMPIASSRGSILSRKSFGKDPVRSSLTLSGKRPA